MDKKRKDRTEWTYWQNEKCRLVEIFRDHNVKGIKYIRCTKKCREIISDSDEETGSEEEDDTLNGPKVFVLGCL